MFCYSAPSSHKNNVRFIYCPEEKKHNVFISFLVQTLSYKRCSSMFLNVYFPSFWERSNYCTQFVYWPGFMIYLAAACRIEV